MQSAQQIGNRVGVVAAQGTATQSEVQTITGTATGGTFRLQFGNQQTAPIARNASAATIQTELRALSNISATGVVCAGGPLATAPVTVTFDAEYKAVDVPTLVVVNIDLSGGTVVVANTTPKAEVAFFDANMATVAAMRTALNLINATYYTSARLDQMTENDMIYALRQLSNPQTI